MNKHIKKVSSYCSGNYGKCTACLFANIGSGRLLLILYSRELNDKRKTKGTFSEIKLLEINVNDSLAKQL